jgi:DNA-binding CsgD family transcriptional regulator
MVKYKDDILRLRESGLSYNEISKEIGCSKALISYHCKRYSLSDIGLSNTNINEKENEIKEYYKDHSKKETADFFKISESSVIRYSDKKRIILDDNERKKRNYIRVSNFRQRLKERAIEYKGGKCEICGYDKCKRSLDFHHRDPNEKDFGIGHSKVLNWDKIKKELDKCDLVCRNCHGEIHDEWDKNRGV